MLEQKLAECHDAGGTHTLIRNPANSDVRRWMGVECEFDSGQRWFESHPTTEICVTRVETEVDPSQLPQNQGRNFCSAD